MDFKVNFIPNAMVSKSYLPDFALPSQHFPQRMGISAFNELDGALQAHSGRGDDQMHMLEHDDEGVQSISSLPFVAVKDLQE
jgi:hypothetical protein